MLIPLIIFIFYNVKIVFKKWEIKSCCCCCINFIFMVVTEEEILQMLTFLECVVLSLSLYMLIQLFSSVSVNSGF